MIHDYCVNNPNQLSFQLIKGGYLNTMVSCGLQGNMKHSDDLAVRVFGEGIASLLNRDKEVMGLQLAHAAGCGTPLVAIFDNGLVVGKAPGQPFQYKLLFNPDIARYMYYMFKFTYYQV